MGPPVGTEITEEDLISWDDETEEDGLIREVNAGAPRHQKRTGLNELELSDDEVWFREFMTNTWQGGDISNIEAEEPSAEYHAWMRGTLEERPKERRKGLISQTDAMLPPNLETEVGSWHMEINDELPASGARIGPRVSTPKSGHSTSRPGDNYVSGLNFSRVTQANSDSLVALTTEQNMEQVSNIHSTPAGVTVEPLTARTERIVKRAAIRTRHTEKKSEPRH